MEGIELGCLVGVIDGFNVGNIVGSWVSPNVGVIYVIKKKMLIICWIDCWYFWWIFSWVYCWNSWWIVCWSSRWCVSRMWCYYCGWTTRTTTTRSINDCTILLLFLLKKKYCKCIFDIKTTNFIFNCWS